MTQHPILLENEGKRLTLRLPLLICFSMFNAWQMGMIYFSSQSLSVDGRVATPMSESLTTPLAAAGYVFSILVMIFLPRIVVWTERVTVSVALLCAVSLFLPLSPELFLLSLYIQFFCCCFMIGFETGIIVNLLSEKTALLHVTVAYAPAILIPALLQNDFIKTPFWIFRLFAVIACVMQMYFYFRLPGKSWPRYVKKTDNLVCPKNLFAGVYLMVGLTALMTLFSISISETIAHGVFTTFLSSAFYCICVYSLWRFKGINPIRCAFVLIGMSALGFVFAIALPYIPALSLPACILLGAGFTGLAIQSFYGVLMAKRYPSRFIAAGFIGLCLVAVLVHAVLLELLRDSPVLMHTAYLVVSVALVVIFFMVMPYLLYTFRGRTLQDIIGIVAEETDEGETAAAESVYIKQAASVIEPEQAEAAASMDDNPHAMRMKNLTRHTFSDLTPREYELADCIMRGLHRAEISREMGIKPDTISKYRKSIYSKLGISKQHELFALAEQLERNPADK